jgi:xylulokinase
MAIQQYFIGIDVSTTASKALAVDQQGNVVASHSSPHNLSTPRPLWSEQDAAEWWTASVASIRAVLEKIPADQVAAIGLTGQMHGLTLLDEQNQPLRPAILWNDQRSARQCAEMTEMVGADRLHDLIGTVLLPGFTAPKIKWVRDNEPEVYAKIRHILLPKDYVRFKLSGSYATDVADGSGMSLMDIRARAWSDELLRIFDIPKAWLPDLCESPDITGRVNREAAAATGLKEGTPIVGGAGDQPAGAIGSGIITQGQASLTVGTSGVAFAASSSYQPDPQGRLHHFCHAVPGSWFYMGVMLSAAGSMRWLHDTVAPSSSYDDLSKAAGEVPAGSRGLLFMPYLTGERNPHPDPLARGAFVGLTLRHGTPELVRAVMEGVAFGMRDNLALLAAQGVKPESAVVSGGAANSPIWTQIIADVTGLPLYTVNSTEGAAYGAALLGAVGVGAWPDLETACRTAIREVDRVLPRNTEPYNRLYPVYQALYPALKDSFHALAQFEE